jgi:hypothetical protein
MLFLSTSSHSTRSSWASLRIMTIRDGLDDVPAGYVDGRHHLTVKPRSATTGFTFITQSGTRQSRAHATLQMAFYTCHPRRRNKSSAYHRQRTFETRTQAHNDGSLPRRSIGAMLVAQDWHPRRAPPELRTARPLQGQSLCVAQS